MSYKEPAPISHDKDPLESMMKRFHVAAEYLKLDEEVYNVLKSSVKKIIVSLPISMDDGSIRVFEGYRVIHSNILGPSKGGLRYDENQYGLAYAEAGAYFRLRNYKKAKEIIEEGLKIMPEHPELKV